MRETIAAAAVLVVVGLMGDSDGPAAATSCAEELNAAPSESSVTIDIDRIAHGIVEEGGERVQWDDIDRI